MKFLVLIFCSFLSLTAFSKCDFYMEKDSILWAGLTLNYGNGLTGIMHEKGYARVYRPDLSDFEVKVVIDEVEGRFFKHAVATFDIKENHFKRDVRCLTQNCAISDLAKATNRAMRDIRKKLPECEN